MAQRDPQAHARAMRQGAQFALPQYGLPREYWGKTKQYFAFSVEYLPLNASATDSKQFTVNNDADFLIMAGTRTVFSSDDQTVVATGLATVQISDTGSGRAWQDIAVHIESLFGSAQNPFWWPYPMLVRAGSTVTVKATALDTVNNRRIRLTFHGVKLFNV